MESKRMESRRMKQKGVQKRMESTTTKPNGTKMKRRTNIFKIYCHEKHLGSRKTRACKSPPN